MRGGALARLNPWRGLADLPPAIWILFSTSLVNRAGTMVLPFLVLYLTSELGFSAARAGLVLSIYGLGAVATAPLAGRLCDRIGAARVMKASLFLSAAIFALFPLVRGWGALVAITLALSVASEGFRPAVMAITADAVPAAQRKAAFAAIRLAINLGMSVGPAVGGVLAQIHFPLLFWVDGATAALAGAVLVLRPIRTMAADAGAEKGAGGQPVRLPGNALRDRLLLYFLVAEIPIIVVFFQDFAAMPLYMVRDLGIASSVYGLTFTLNTIMIVFAELKLSEWMAGWPHRRALALGAVLISVGFGSLLLCRDAWSIYLTVVIWTVGEMITFPTMSAYVADVAPQGRRGEYMGLHTMVWGLSFAFGPWLGTVTLDRFGAGPLWVGALLVGLLSALMLGMAREPDSAATSA